MIHEALQASQSLFYDERTELLLHQIARRCRMCHVEAQLSIRYTFGQWGRFQGQGVDAVRVGFRNCITSGGRADVNLVMDIVVDFASTFTTAVNFQDLLRLFVFTTQLFGSGVLRNMFDNAFHIERWSSSLCDVQSNGPYHFPRPLV